MKTELILILPSYPRLMLGIFIANMFYTIANCCHKKFWIRKAGGIDFWGGGMSKIVLYFSTTVYRFPCLFYLYLYPSFSTFLFVLFFLPFCLLEHKELDLIISHILISLELGIASKQGMNSQTKITTEFHCSGHYPNKLLKSFNY